MRSINRIVGGVVLAAAGTALAVRSAWADGVEVQLCDGRTTVALAATPQTRAEGFAVSAALMAQWQARHPGQTWTMGSAADDPDQREALLRKRYQPKTPFDNRALLGEGQKGGHPYRDFTERDVVLWERETLKLVLEGAEVFHDAKRLGSTIAVSCDMCHPDASNTHPETYPKYQTQIGRAVMLREMINWCIEHPLRGKPLAHDDPRMLAMEAYIHAQRQGTPLQFGRH
jgi:hypothetical protein